MIPRIFSERWKVIVIILIFLGQNAQVNGATSSLDEAQPIGLWPLNAATRGRDMSGSGNHVTDDAMTFAEGADGYPDSALEFPTGKFYYIKQRSGNKSVDVGRSFTVMVHVRLETTGLFYIFDWRSDTPARDHLVFKAMMPRMVLYEKVSGQFLVNENFGELRFQVHQWYFVALAYDHLKRTTLACVDEKCQAVSQDAGSSGAEHSSFTDVKIGTEGNAGTRLACVRLYGSAMTETDILKKRHYSPHCLDGGAFFTLYEKAFSIPPEDIVANTPMYGIFDCINQCLLTRTCWAINVSSQSCIMGIYRNETLLTSGSDTAYVMVTDAV